MSACYNLLQKKVRRIDRITVLEIAIMVESIVDISNSVMVLAESADYRE